jgi:uncharacterized protein YciI
MKTVLLFAALFVSSQSLLAQSSGWDMNKLKTYYMVFLKKGPSRDQDAETAGKIQEARLAYLKSLFDAGKISLNGPFLDEGEILGISVYDVATLDEARELASNDPAVKAGRLVVEIRQWMTFRDTGLK